MGQDTWTRTAAGVAQADFDPKRGAGPIAFPRLPMAMELAKVSLAGGSAYADVQLDLSGTGMTRIEAALWWPETRLTPAGVAPPYTYDHADVNLELYAPFSMTPVAVSRNAPGVFERAGADVAPSQRLQWTVRAQGNGIPTYPGGQPVYIAVYAY
jgi:hypothetical protein